jgi:hypothetical protein
MLKALTAFALVTGVSCAALAQTGTGGSSGGMPGGGGTSATSPSSRLPGTMPGRSDTAPGSGRPSAGRSVVPRGPSAAQQSREGGGNTELNNNSATLGPTGVGPSGLDTQGTVGSGTVTPRSSTQPPLGPGTGAPDRGVPDSGVYNPGVGSPRR